MKRPNPLGFLGLVGLIGFAGFFSESSTAFPYFAYFLYFGYFAQPFTEKLKRTAKSALALAYLFAFSVSLAFILAINLGADVDYQTGFYFAYSAGGFSFPIAFTLLKLWDALRKKRAAVEA